MRKLDRTAAAGTSAASTTSDVRLLAASVMPVTALVSPGPWCTLSRPVRPAVRAHPSAMAAAPPSCRAATYRAPWLIRALVMWKLPLPTTPNTVSAPSPAKVAATASVTRIRSGEPGRLPVRAPGGPLDEADSPARAARAPGDRQRAGDHHRALGRQQGQVLQLRQPVLPGAQQRCVA